MNIKKNLILIPFAIAITGCGDSSISLVKESRMESFPDYKIEQVVDNYEFCESTQWNAIEGNSGNTYVTFTCSFDINSNSKNAAIAELDRTISILNENIEYSNSKTPTDIAETEESLASTEKRLAEAMAQGKDEQSLKWYKDRIRSDQDILQRQKNAHQERMNKTQSQLSHKKIIKQKIEELGAGKLEITYNVINESVTFRESKINFNEYTFPVQKRDYFLLSKMQIASTEIKSTWEKIIQDYLIAITKD